MSRRATINVRAADPTVSRRATINVRAADPTQPTHLDTHTGRERRPRRINPDEADRAGTKQTRQHSRQRWPTAVRIRVDSRE